MRETPYQRHIKCTDYGVPIRKPLSGVPCRRPATHNIAHARILTATVATAPARNSARKLISSIVPQFQGYALFGDRFIRFRCDSKAHTAVLVCSAPLRGRSTQLRIGTYCIWHYYSIIDELAQYRNCNRSARPTGQYPKLLASAFASFTPVL